MHNQRPDWYTDDDDSTWERIKNAIKNDWEQTKNDFGSDTARDLEQDVDDTLKQAAGADDAFENQEKAFRFGHAARRQFGADHSAWSDDLEDQLKIDYSGNYTLDRDSIRRAYEYNS